MIRVTDRTRHATRDLFEKSAPYCIQTYDHANVRPVIFAEHDVVLLLSGRAGSSFAMKWYLHHNGMTSDYVFTHEHRMNVIYQADWHQQRRNEIYGGAPFRTIRFVRNPFSRAVSSFLHSTRNEEVYRDIVEFLGNDRGYSFMDFLRYVSDVGVQRVDHHLAQQCSYLEKLFDLDAFYRVEGGLESLNELERTLGLPETDAKLFLELRISGHDLRYQPGRGDVSEQILAVGMRLDSYPSPDRFYNDRTEEMVRDLYSLDFRRFGYDTSLPDLSAKEVVRTQTLPRKTRTGAATHPAARPLRQALDDAGRSGARMWSEIEQRFLGAVAQFDAAPSPAGAGLENAKEDLFADIVALLLENGSGIETLYTSRAIPGLVTKAYRLEGVYPRTGEIGFFMDVALVETPGSVRKPHASRPRAARSVGKVVTRIGHRAVDIKMGSAQQGEVSAEEPASGPAGLGIVPWLHSVPPKIFLFLAVCVTDKQDLAAAIRHAETAARVFDGVGLFCFEAAGEGATAEYRTVDGMPARLTLDRVLVDACKVLMDLGN